MHHLTAATSQNQASANGHHATLAEPPWMDDAPLPHLAAEAVRKPWDYYTDLLAMLPADAGLIPVQGGSRAPWTSQKTGKTSHPGKSPTLAAWQNNPRPLPEIKEHYLTEAGNVGLLGGWGRLVIVDADDKTIVDADGKTHTATRSAGRAAMPALVATGEIYRENATERTKWLVRMVDGEPMPANAKWDGLEVIARGGQAVIAGDHASGVPLLWRGDKIVDVTFAELAHLVKTCAGATLQAEGTPPPRNKTGSSNTDGTTAQASVDRLLQRLGVAGGGWVADGAGWKQELDGCPVATLPEAGGRPHRTGGKAAVGVTAEGGKWFTCQSPRCQNAIHALAPTDDAGNRSGWRFLRKLAGDELETFPELETDMGNGRRFARMHGTKVRYVQAWGWLHWNGKYWQRDDIGAVMSLAKATADGLFAEASAQSRKAADLVDAMKKAGEEEQKQLKEAADKATADGKRAVGWALKTQARPRMEAMIALAQSEPGIAALPNDFDTDPWLLNVQNGTIDLKSGKLLQHDPSRQITTIAPVDYLPQAKSPMFDAFLRQIFADNEELIAYVLKFFGSCLTGDVSQQHLHILHGSGANGKSTLIRVVLDLLGSGYAGQAAPDLLLTGNDQRHPTEVADLRGRRFVAAVETEEGRRLNESLVKQLTGGDKVKARYMKQDFFEFAPTWKLALVTNPLPKVGSGHAIFRRLRLIPFTVTIPEAEQDLHLLEKLETERAGILATLVRGCLQWQNEGLPAPSTVKTATGAYQEASDVLGLFLAEHTEPGDRVQAGVLWAAYRAWCAAGNMREGHLTDFGKKITDKGIEKYIDRSRRTYYLGIKLIDVQAEEEPVQAEIPGAVVDDPRKHSR